MKKPLLLTLFSTLFLSVLVGQYQDRYWVMGRTFSASTNVSFNFYTNGLALYDVTGAPPQMNPTPNNISSSNGFEGWGVVTNPETGELFFYTDGEEVFDANHLDITPSGGLGANPSSSQAVAIAVNPVCPFNQYYIFSNPAGVINSNGSTGPATYRLYTVGSGFSEITALPGPDGNENVGEGMLIIPSKTDPFTSWLIIRLLSPTSSGSNYVVYQIDGSGISHSGTFNFGPPVTDNPYSPIMNISYVDDGSTEDVIVGFTVSGQPNRVFTNRFNTTTGSFYDDVNQLASFSSGTLYDLEFSPGGNYVYYASYAPSVLYQIPINGGIAVQMRNFGNLRGGGLKRAPDGFIYHIYRAGNNNSGTQVRIGRLIEPETGYDGSNFNDLYEADFNSSVSMIYDNVFCYNFPEFAGAPTWSVDLNLTGDNPICPGNQTSLAASINSLGQNINDYSWALNGSFLTTTETSALDVDQPGTYQVTVNLENGCAIASNLITIEESSNPPQIDNIITNETPCGDAAGTISIEASAGTGTLSYSIDGSNFSTATTYQDLPAGTYLVVVQDELGCTSSQTVEIMQTEAGPSIDFLAFTEASCLDGDGTLSISASGVGSLQYSLDGTTFQNEDTFSELLAGTYTVYVEDQNECLTTATVEVPQIDNGPQIEDITTSPASCLDNDGSLSILASGENGSLTYTLDGLGSQVSNQFPGLAAGNYTVTVQDGVGCEASQEIEVEADVTLPLIQAITFNRPSCNMNNGLINIEASSTAGALSYSVNGFLFQDSNTFTNLGANEYLIQIQDELGCTVDTTLTLLERNCPVFIPNVFSPNNDGVNDRFQLFSNGEPGTVIQRYLIFDRWGELIFEASDFDPAEQDKFWNGTFRGQTMAVGVYTYVIEVGYADGVVDLLKGDVLLLR